MSLPGLTVADPFRRELSEFVTVHVDGIFDNIDRDITERSPGRVVISMPDFTADALAHVLSYLGRIAEALDSERLGVSPTELAEALYQAAASAGVRCPEGALQAVGS